MASSDQAALPRHAGAPDAALPGATEPGATEPGAALPGHALLLLAALAATAVAQGGYYPAGRIVALTLTIVAAVLAGRAGHRAGTGIWPVPVVYLVVACAGLALWTVADGLLHPGPAGGAGGGVPLLAGLGCLAAAATVVRHTGSAQIGTAQGGTAQSGSVDGGPGPRELFADAVVALGPLVAVPGWIGVAWHRPPWASVVEGLWRAGSTLTYANAAAALLAALCLLALARVIDRPGSLVRAGMAYLSLVGLAATMSRAGLVAFGVGLIPLVLLAGARGRWLVALQILPLLLGAAVALAGLAPSVPASAPARPLPALIGLAIGGVLAFGATSVGATGLRARAGARLVRRVSLAGCLAAILGLAALAWTSPAARSLLSARLSLDSSERGGAARAALRLIADQPWIGTGPGRSRYIWTAPDGQLQIGRYAHDEYLQLLAELGAIGLALLLCVLVAVVLTIRAGRIDLAGVDLAGVSHVRTGAIAALVALAVHSGFDFLWQLAVVPLAVGTFIGLAGPVTVRPVTIRPVTISPREEMQAHHSDPKEEP